MTSTVSDLFAAAGLQTSGAVRWGEPLAEGRSGVYVISLCASPDEVCGTRAKAPLSPDSLDQLLDRCSGLTLDSLPNPTRNELVERISKYWIQDECVLYIGLAGQPLRKRVSQYYRTPIGAAKPHKGGWWLKTLSVLPELFVHYAVTPDFKEAEEEMMRVFAANVSASASSNWPVGEPTMPFANLRDADWRRRKHGIKGATGGKTSKRVRSVQAIGDVVAESEDPKLKPRSITTKKAASSRRMLPHLRSQNVTAKDIAAGQIRVPRGATKGQMPQEPSDIDVSLKGSEARCRWNPRYGPPEKSGTIRVGKAMAKELLEEGEILAISEGDEGTIYIT